jgi:hypothetical protein
MIWYIELISIDHICIHLSTWRSNHWISREFIHSRGGPRAQPCSCWPAGRGAAGCTSRNLWSRSAQRHWDVGQKKLTWLWGVQCYGEILTDLLSLYIFINIHTVYIYIYIYYYVILIMDGGPTPLVGCGLSCGCVWKSGTSRKIASETYDETMKPSNLGYHILRQNPRIQHTHVHF